MVKTENDFDVKVLGTEFEVYARHQDRKVVLNKGKVQLQYPEGTHQKQVLLQPGDHFELNQISNTAKVLQLALPRHKRKPSVPKKNRIRPKGNQSLER